MPPEFMPSELNDRHLAHAYLSETLARWHEVSAISELHLKGLLAGLHASLVEPTHGERPDVPVTQDCEWQAPQTVPPQWSETERCSRALTFLERHIGALRHCGTLPPNSELDELIRQEMVRNQLPPELRTATSSSVDQLDAQALPADASPATSPADGQHAFLMRLLDPNSLRTMMLCGGGLLVAGVVAWLWSIGVFENPIVAAAALGSVNLMIIGTGVAAVLRTRFTTAGQAVALLGCLLLPLNLWFYDAQGLVTLSAGGHLWIPALACCVIYAAVIGVLKDHVFVYALVGGIALTGLLLLADTQVGRLWEVLAPAGLLVSLGAVCIQLEQMFLREHPVYNRQTFGKAMFLSGHTALGAGLTILLAGRLFGHFYHELGFLSYLAMPDVMVARQAQWLALLLIGVGTFSYTHSFFRVKRERGERPWGYLALSALTLLWAQVVLLDVLDIAITSQVVATLLASFGILTSAASIVKTLSMRSQSVLSNETHALLSVLNRLAAATTAAACALAAFHSCGATFDELIVSGRSGLSGIDAMLCAELLLTSLAAGFCAVAQYNHRGRKLADGFAAVTLVGFVVTLLTFGIYIGLGFQTSLIVAVVLLAATTEALVRALPKPIAERLLSPIDIVVAFVTLVAMTNWIVVHHNVASGTSELRAIALVGLALVAGRQAIQFTRTSSLTIGAFAAWLALVQLCRLADFSMYAPIVSGSVLGALFALTSRAITATAGSPPTGRTLATPLEHCGAGLTALASGAGLLLTLSRLTFGGPNWELVGLAIAQLVVVATVALASRGPAIRSVFTTLGLAHLVAGLATIHALSTLTIDQRVEVFAVMIGMALLVLGHWGWYRETGEEDPLVDGQLTLGSLVIPIALSYGLVAHRLFGANDPWAWVVLHEVGVLLIGLVLLGSGVLCRIRSTTLAGGGLLLVYLGSALALIDLPDQLQTAAVYMMVGGGIFFGVAVLLSIYRDRLLALPQKIRSGEGVFQVLTWR